MSDNEELITSDNNEKLTVLPTRERILTPLNMTIKEMLKQRYYKECEKYETKPESLFYKSEAELKGVIDYIDSCKIVLEKIIRDEDRSKPTDAEINRDSKPTDAEINRDEKSKTQINTYDLLNLLMKSDPTILMADSDPIISKTQSDAMTSRIESELTMLRMDNALKLLNDFLYFYHHPLFSVTSIEMSEQEQVNGFNLCDEKYVQEIITYDNFRQLYPLLHDTTRFVLEDFHWQIVPLMIYGKFGIIDENGKTNFLDDKDTSNRKQQNVEALFNLPYSHNLLISVIKIIIEDELRINGLYVGEKNKVNINSIRGQLVKYSVRYINAICVWIQRKLAAIRNAENEFRRFIKLNFTDTWIIVMDYYHIPL